MILGVALIVSRILLLGQTHSDVENDSASFLALDPLTESSVTPSVRMGVDGRHVVVCVRT